MCSHKLLQTPHKRSASKYLLEGIKINATQKLFAAHFSSSSPLSSASVSERMLVKDVQRQFHFTTHPAIKPVHAGTVTQGTAALNFKYAYNDSFGESVQLCINN